MFARTIKWNGAYVEVPAFIAFMANQKERAVSLPPSAERIMSKQEIERRISEAAANVGR